MHEHQQGYNPTAKETIQLSFTEKLETILPAFSVSRENLVELSIAVEDVNQMSVIDLSSIAEQARRHIVEQLLPEEIFHQAERVIQKNGILEFDLGDTESVDLIDLLEEPTPIPERSKQLLEHT